MQPDIYIKMETEKTTEKKISLHINRKDFEEIYFAGSQSSTFLSSTTKTKTLLTIIVAAILILLIVFRDSMSAENEGIIYFVSFLFLLCAVYLSVAVNKVSRWKKQVQKYLDTLENAKIFELIFTHETFGVQLNENSENSLWEDFESAEINENFIAMEGKYSYMFPKKSMTTAEFALLQNAVQKHIIKKTQRR